MSTSESIDRLRKFVETAHGAICVSHAGGVCIAGRPAIKPVNLSDIAAALARIEELEVVAGPLLEKAQNLTALNHEVLTLLRDSPQEQTGWYAASVKTAPRNRSVLQTLLSFCTEGWVPDDGRGWRLSDAGRAELERLESRQT